MNKKVAVPCTNPERMDPYCKALASVGLEPVVIIPGTGFRFASCCTGLLLAGGRDIDPAHYGQEPEPETRKPDKARDNLESQLLKQALGANMPVLAICRGMQMLNAVAGGTLIQHLPTAQRHSGKQEDGSRPTHEVELVAHSALALLLGATRFTVNSGHHQALDRLGERVIVVGRCPDDDVVEAIELLGYGFCLGVQWHPEDMIDSSAEARKLFAAFAEAL